MLEFKAFVLFLSLYSLFLLGDYHMKNPDPIVIVGSARTPIGGLLGMLSSLRAQDLGAIAIQSAIERAGIAKEDIGEVIMGCVLAAGLGQAPVRQAALLAGLPQSVECSTINKVCGSGMKSVMLAYDLLLAGTHPIMIAGGMESMSNAPYILEKARIGHRFGHGTLRDHMLLDGLEDAYEKGTSMGVFAERTAEKYGFSRNAQDEFALNSLKRAMEASEKGWFLSDVEITPIQLASSKSDKSAKSDNSDKIDQDEQPKNAKPEKIPHLKPAFKENGTVTAANSSSISDGAAALVLMRASEALKRGLKPKARILGHASFSQEPAWFTTAPVAAVQKLLKQCGWTSSTPDLYEINEAFACVTMAAMRDLNIAHEKVNVHGGACALGHPIGASGTRLICSLLGALKRQNKSLGIATLCVGGGEATALAIERLD